MTMASTLLVDHVLDAADHRGDVVLGVDDVDVPALFLGGRLEGLDVELGARLGEIGGDDRHLLGEGGAGSGRGERRARDGETGDESGFELEHGDRSSCKVASCRPPRRYAADGCFPYASRALYTGARKLLRFQREK
jgi:hypothetical protein